MGAAQNPLLQDPGLALHPPILYAGYVGFSISFSFAVAALIEGKVDAAWALGTSLDVARVVVPDRGNRTRQLVGVLRTRLGGWWYWIRWKTLPLCRG